MSGILPGLRTKLKRSPQLRSVLTIIALLLLVFTGMALYSDTYASVRNVTNLIVQSVPLAIVSLGQTLVIISGGIDLSVGSTISLSTAIAARMMDTSDPWALALAFLAVFGAAALVGLVNGVGVNFLHVPPMITTLCTGTMLSGLSLLLLPMAGGRVNKELAGFIMQKWTVVSMPLVILALAYIAARHVLYHTGTGVGLYAIGKNRSIASSMGVRAHRVSVAAYVMAALFAALTGVMLAARMRMGDPIVGTPYAMDSITATAIGGTSLSGGVGLLAGTAAGAFMVGMLSNLMNILGVNQFYQYVVKGSLLILAMIVYSLSAMVEGRRRAR